MKEKKTTNFKIKILKTMVLRKRKESLLTKQICTREIFRFVCVKSQREKHKELESSFMMHLAKSSRR